MRVTRHINIQLLLDACSHLCGSSIACLADSGRSYLSFRYTVRICRLRGGLHTMYTEVHRNSRLHLRIALYMHVHTVFLIIAISRMTAVTVDLEICIITPYLHWNCTGEGWLQCLSSKRLKALSNDHRGKAVSILTKDRGTKRGVNKRKICTRFSLRDFVSHSRVEDFLVRPLLWSNTAAPLHHSSKSFLKWISLCLATVTFFPTFISPSPSPLKLSKVNIPHNWIRMFLQFIWFSTIGILVPCHVRYEIEY